MKKNLYFISQNLPNSFIGGSAQVNLNLIKELKRNYNIIAINTVKGFYKPSDFLKAKKELKKEKIKFLNINKKTNNVRLKNITIFNFFQANYFNIKRILEIKLFIRKLNIKKDDIILCHGSNTIMACKNLNCIKIALLEDIQDQVQFYRTYLSINRYNFLKRIIKLLMLKIHFRKYHQWLKKITNNYDIIYTHSPFDYLKLKNKINLSVLPVAINFKNSKKKEKKIFNISMFSFSITQDYNGVKLLYQKLLPKLKKNRLMDIVKLNLVMRIPKKNPANIEEIIHNKNINIKQFNKKSLDDTDLLFYPSKYPVGVRSKIIFAFARSWLVATSTTIKKCIPELKDGVNCLMSNNTDLLIDKIIELIQNKKRKKKLLKNSKKVLNNYHTKKAAKKIIKDLKKII